MASNSVAPVVNKVLKSVENQIDEEIEKLDNLTVDDLEEIRRKRLEQMKSEAKNRQEWKAKGHGEYSEIVEKEFFEIVKKSTRCVVHFYTPTSERRRIFDFHLNLLAVKHLETRFVKLDAEKCPFLTQKLNITVIPMLLNVKDTRVVDRVVGFTDLGNCDDFSTEMLEWRLGCCGIIDYEDDIRQPPEKAKMSQAVHRAGVKKTIRGPAIDDDDSDLEDLLDDESPRDVAGDEENK